MRLPVCAAAVLAAAPSLADTITYTYDGSPLDCVEPLLGCYVGGQYPNGLDGSIELDPSNYFGLGSLAETTLTLTSDNSGSATSWKVLSGSTTYSANSNDHSYGGIVVSTSGVFVGMVSYPGIGGANQLTLVFDANMKITRWSGGVYTGTPDTDWGISNIRDGSGSGERSLSPGVWSSNISAVPIPGTLSMLLAGVCFAGAVGRRRTRQLS